jgi:uncharacterized protein (DUF433 family)
MHALVQKFEASVPEAAFIADISDRDVNRVIDEAILPEELFANVPRARRFPALACALASFYFQEEDLLTKRARQRVISSLIYQLREHEDFSRLLDLNLAINAPDWEVTLDNLKVELANYATQVKQRIESVIEAESMVTTDPEILAGEPVFNGTRIPVRTIAAWMDEGVDGQTIQQAYPSVTDDMLRIAPIYVRTNPRRGRPPQFGDVNRNWTLKKTTRVTLPR